MAKKNQSIFQQDLSSLISFEGLRRKSPELMLSRVLLLITIMTTLSSVIFLIINTVRSNRTNIPPQEGQLLNRVSIEKAAQLLQEETVQFSPDDS